MKKISVKKVLFSETTSMILFFIGVVLMFAGVFVSVLALDFAGESMVVLSIGLIALLLGIGLMVITALSKNEGIFGFIFGVMLTISMSAFMLTQFVGILPWLPYNEATQTALFLIAMPLMLAGGGGAAAVRIFVIFV